LLDKNEPNFSPVAGQIESSRSFFPRMSESSTFFQKGYFVFKSVYSPEQIHQLKQSIMCSVFGVLNIPNAQEKDLSMLVDKKAREDYIATNRTHSAQIPTARKRGRRRRGNASFGD
jgi:hypothetical protein